MRSACQVTSQVVDTGEAMFLVMKWQVAAKRAACGEERRQESELLGCWKGSESM